MSGPEATALDAATLDADEQGLVDGVAARREELIELACRLIAFDTTSRSGPEDPPREEAALQSAARRPPARARRRDRPVGARPE